MLIDTSDLARQLTSARDAAAELAATLNDRRDELIAAGYSASKVDDARTVLAAMPGHWAVVIAAIKSGSNERPAEKPQSE